METIQNKSCTHATIKNVFHKNNTATNKLEKKPFQMVIKVRGSISKRTSKWVLAKNRF